MNNMCRNCYATLAEPEKPCPNCGWDGSKEKKQEATAKIQEDLYWKRVLKHLEDISDRLERIDQCLKGQ